MSWSNYTRADEFCESVRDGTHDSPKPVAVAGKPLITSKHIKGGNLDLENSYSISEDDFDKINKRSLVEKWDVLISMIGTLGQVFLVNEAPTYAIKNIGLFKTKSEDDGTWLSYYLQSPPAKNFIDTNSQGSTQQYLSLKTLRSFPILVPPSEQDKKAVNLVLSEIDKLIELNRKTNSTLEEIAKAIFKSWFVDFDPVRAKAKGRPTGLPSEISDLFPDELVESEIGEIPKGWEVKTLGDCNFEIESGRRPKGGIDKSLNDGIPSVGAESIDSIGKFDYAKVKHVTLEFASSVKKGWVKNFDVALYKDGGKPGQFIPRVGLYGEDFPFKKFLVNEHVFLLRSALLGQVYLYYLVSSNAILDQLIARGSAKAAQPGLNQEEVRTSYFKSPDSVVLYVFNDIVTPIVKRQLMLGKENLILQELRDTLLPKLISGELRIPDTEKFLEEAGM